MMSIVETGFRGGAIALHLLFAVLILREARHAPALLAQPMAREPCSGFGALALERPSCDRHHIKLVLSMS